MALVAKMRPMANALVIGDPPAHGRQKAIADKWLNGAHIKAMEPLIHEVVDHTIDRWIDDGHCEFVEQFAIPVPLTLIAHALGVGESDLARFKVWTDHLEMGYMEPLDNEQRLQVATSVLEFQDYIVEQIADRSANPTDDLISALVNARLSEDDTELEDSQAAGADRLSEAEILTMTSQLLAAGNVTTTSLMANLMVSLIENPQAMADLRADHSLIDAAIDESLRRDSPARCGYRMTKQDIELENVTIPAGSQVFFSFGAANHDPELYPEPTQFDIHRANLKRHLGFGHGVHYCVGSHLARAETRIAFERLLNRISDFRIPEDKRPEPIICLALHGYRRVDLTFTKAS
ncbi:MAG: cytochrome P450 [Acidimicrobiales bacterium]